MRTKAHVKQETVGNESLSPMMGLVASSTTLLAGYTSVGWHWPKLALPVYFRDNLADRVANVSQTETNETWP